MATERLLELSDLSMAEAFREFARRSGGDVRDEEGLLLVAGSHPFPSLVVTGAIRSDPSLDAVEAIDRAERHFGQRDRFWIFTAAHADGDLDNELRRREYRLLLDAAGMVLHRPLKEKPLPAGTELRWVEDEAGVRAFASISGEAFGDPSLEEPTLTDPASLSGDNLATVVAYLDGSPASAGLVTVNHDVALVGFIGTKVAARKRGLGEAVTRAVTNRGFDLGARLASLQASPEGDPIYRRIGYEEITRYRLWLSPTSG